MDSDDGKLAAIRAGVPVTERIAFLNTGSHGPLTAAAGAVIAEMAEQEVTRGRLGAAQFALTGELRRGTRAGFARVLGCEADEVALTSSTTAAMNAACWGLNWASGDEVITTTAEHQADWASFTFWRAALASACDLPTLGARANGCSTRSRHRSMTARGS